MVTKSKKLEKVILVSGVNQWRYYCPLSTGCFLLAAYRFSVCDKDGRMQQTSEHCVTDREERKECLKRKGIKEGLEKQIICKEVKKKSRTYLTEFLEWRHVV
jgi:hypothetical protein